MRYPLLFSFFITTLISLTLPIHAEEPYYPLQESKALAQYTIGIITDGSNKSSTEMAELFRREIEKVASDEYSIKFPKKYLLQNHTTPAGINRNIDSLLNSPEVDLIITLGTVGSTEALKRTTPAKPIIAPFVFDVTLQKAPGNEFGSGVNNLTYIALGSSVNSSVNTFRKIIPFTRLAILMDAHDLNGIEAVNKLAPRIANEHTIDVVTIPVNTAAEKAIQKIPTNTEAVMVGPLWQMGTKDIKLLSKYLIQRKLPSFSLWNFEYVKNGLLATTMPENTGEHLARRVAVTVQEILLGEEVASIPVSFSKTQKLAFNMETARAIDIYPSLDAMTGSILLNEQRKDIQRRLNLQNAVQEALIANLDLIVAEKEVTAGTYAVGEARSTLFPQVGIGAVGRTIDNDRASVGSGMTPENALIGRATASQQIYSEKSWSGYSVEKYRQTGREFNRDTTRLDIILESSSAYLNVLRQKTIEQLQKENMALTLANLERAQIRLSTGVAGPDELYRWQTEFANARQVVLRAESSTFNAMQSLNRILHRPLQEAFIAEETDLSDPLLITGDQLFYQLMHNPRYLMTFNSFALSEGVAISPELQFLDSQIAAQERIITRSKREFWLPDFTVEGNVDQLLSNSGDGKRNEDTSGLDDTEWAVGVYARLPLFEGGKKSSTLGRNKEQLVQLKTQRQATEERISQRILFSLNNTRASYPSINLSREAADAASRNLKLVTDSYVQGIKSIIDLLDAQNQALNADLDAANAVYNFLIDLMGVQRAIGNFIVFLPQKEQEQWMNKAKEYLQLQATN